MIRALVDGVRPLGVPLHPNSLEADVRARGVREASRRVPPGGPGRCCEGRDTHLPRLELGFTAPAPWADTIGYHREL